MLQQDKINKEAVITRTIADIYKLMLKTNNEYKMDR